VSKVRGECDERARLAEMHSSSPHWFAVTTFTHGSGGKRQTQQEPERSEPDLDAVLQTAEKSWENELQRVRDRVPRKRGMPKAIRRICDIPV